MISRLLVAALGVTSALRLAEASGLEVEAVDERLTSVEADRRLAEAGTAKRDRAARIDGEAAAIMLQQWLDQQRTGQTTD